MEIAAVQPVNSARPDFSQEKGKANAWTNSNGVGRCSGDLGHIHRVIGQNILPAEAAGDRQDATSNSYAMMESYQTGAPRPSTRARWVCRRLQRVSGIIPEPFTLPTRHRHAETTTRRTPGHGSILRADPMVVSVPAVPKDRYYVMQWIDLFTQNFAYIGVRSDRLRRRQLHDRRPEMEGQEARRYQRGAQG